MKKTSVLMCALFTFLIGCDSAETPFKGETIDDQSLGSVDKDSAIGPALDASISETITPSVIITELMASNDTTIADEHGEYDDWFELYNVSEGTVDLGGWRISDEADFETAFEFEAGTLIEPMEFLIIWADNDLEQGPLHASFKLSGDGEMLVLFHPEGEIMDSVTFGPQSPDTSLARSGDDTFAESSSPTPGSSNLDQ